MQTVVYTFASGVPELRGETQDEIDCLRSVERCSQTQERGEQVDRSQSGSYFFSALQGKASRRATSATSVKFSEYLSGWFFAYATKTAIS